MYLRGMIYEQVVCCLFQNFLHRCPAKQHPSPNTRVCPAYPSSLLSVQFTRQPRSQITARAMPLLQIRTLYYFSPFLDTLKVPETENIRAITLMYIVCREGWGFTILMNNICLKIKSDPCYYIKAGLSRILLSDSSGTNTAGAELFPAGPCIHVSAATIFTKFSMKS